MESRLYAAEQPKHIGGALNAIIGRIKTAIEETQTAIENVKSCPSPCSDRTVFITTKSGITRRVTCPIADESCSYGKRLKDELNSYLARVMSDAGVPKLHINSLCSYRHSISVQAACEWRYRGFLFLCGSSDPGKSFTAVCVLRKYLKSRITDRMDKDTWRKTEPAQFGASWINASDISGDRETANMAKTAYFLVLDDFGAENDVRANHSVMNRIISARYEAMLPTIITTGLALESIKSKYGARTAERIVGGKYDGGRVIDCSKNLNNNKPLTDDILENSDKIIDELKESKKHDHQPEAEA